MPDQTRKLYFSPFQMILAWSTEWPIWQRDAVRRIVVHGGISPDDLEELFTICLSSCQVPIKRKAVEPIPLSDEHILTGPYSSTSVSLVSFGPLKSVNRLLSDQILEYGPEKALTVVYGENGAGKSGYVRVIKKVCRTRGVVPKIIPNVFEEREEAPSSGDITFTDGTTKHTVSWTDGIACDQRLTNVFVFDGVSASHHVSDDGPASFTPRGLDVLPKLALACDELKKRLRLEIDGLESHNTNGRLHWEYQATTQVGKLLDALTAQTTSEQIERDAVFSDADKNRLSEIGELLKADPLQKSTATKASADRIRAFAEALKARVLKLNDAMIEKTQKAISESVACATISKATAAGYFDETYLPETGGEVWRQLWDIAKKYSVNQAYNGKAFPFTDQGSRCVLCQQEIDRKGAQRLKHFYKYVEDAAQKRARAAEVNLQTLRNQLSGLPLLAGDFSRIASDLGSESADAQKLLETFIEAIDTRAQIVSKSLTTLSWEVPKPLSEDPTNRLDEIATLLDERAVMLQTMDDPTRRMELQRESSELADRRWLNLHKQVVIDHVARLKELSTLKKCVSETATNTITLKSSQLHDTFVNEAFCTQFGLERDRLGLKSFPVKLESLKGEKGTRSFGVRMDAKQQHRVSDIASEGELRCVALAAFLAELSQSSHKSTLVFDDPVSSLDHKRRGLIAQRLVEEAKERQVIVFTHDLAFICDLQEAAQDDGIHIHGRHIDWSADFPGRCHNELPWEGQTTKAQIKKLRELCKQAARESQVSGQTEYRAFALHVCGLIRAAAERIIEEELLCGVLKRHQSGIHMGALKGVATNESADYTIVHGVWKDVSDLIPSHSASRSRQVEPPDPTQLSKFVETLSSVCEAVRARRKQDNTSPSLSGGALPAAMSC